MEPESYFTGYLETLIEEYKAVNAEIELHLGYQSQIVLASLVTLGAAATVIYQAGDKDIYLPLLIIPILFSLMGMVYLGYLGVGYRSMIYIEEYLRPQIQGLFSEKPASQHIELLRWQSTIRNKDLRLFAFPKSFEIALFLLPSLGALVIFFLSKGNSGASLDLSEWLMITLGGFLIMVNLVFAFLFAIAGIRKVRASDSR